MAKHPDRVRLSRCAFAFLLVAAVGIFAGPALAHDVRVPVEGTSILIRTDGTPAEREFAFESADVDIAPEDDPRTHPSYLLVRTFDGSGTTEVIALDQGKWSELRDPGTNVLRGYHYDDAGPSPSGGVTHIELENGRLVIAAGGAGWPWSPGGSLDDLWVTLRIEEFVICSAWNDDTEPDVDTNHAGHYEAVDALAPSSCPAFCGDLVRDLGEECDDGNAVDDDTCSNTCQISEVCQTQDFDSTFEAIQSVIFDGYSCTNEACHGGPPEGTEGRLDLSAAVAYDNIVNHPAYNSDLDLVEPGEAPASFLYEKIAARTLGTPTIGTSMPTNAAPAVTPDHLEALRKWIRGGAPREGVVEGTAALLGTCLPPDSPLKLDPPDAPPKGEGIQLQQTAYTLHHESETELCMATYFDFTQTDLIPPELQYPCPRFPDYSTNNPSGLCFAYKRQILLQDPQSHHSIIHVYNGTTLADHEDDSARNEDFGPFTLKRNALDAPDNGQACDPFDIDPALGFNPDCSGRAQPAIACLGWGPEDASIAPTVGGSQEPYWDMAFADGVYSHMPMTGVMIWNSHAFNLTESDTTMNQYFNLMLSQADEREFPVQRIFDIDSDESPLLGHIFAMSYPPIQPFTSREICLTHTVDEYRMRPAKVFELTSHTHQFGTLFRIWEPPNEPCEQWEAACKPGPDERLIYTSREYTDPVDLIIDPPYFFDGEEEADRSFLYCSVFDNGSTDTSPKVKHKSTAQASPFGNACTVPKLPPDNRPYRACLEGPFRSAECTTDEECDTFPGSGDGECDEVCTLVGGFTTTDEMFILIGSYYIDGTPLDAPPPAPVVAPPPAAASFCGLIGIELLWLWPAARWLRGRRRRA